MSSRWTGFFVWVLVAASSAFWGLKIFAATRPVPPGAQVPQRAIALGGPMESLFGAVVVPEVAQEEAPPAASQRFQLVGVIAPRAGSGSRDGVAIVSIDGQPAKSWHVGATVEGDTILLSVAKRGAEFGPKGGPVAFALTLPEPAAALTGTLPPPVSQPYARAAPGAVPPPPPAPPPTAPSPSPPSGMGGYRGAYPAAGGQPNLRNPALIRPGMGPAGGMPPGRWLPPQGVPPTEQMMPAPSPPNEGAVVPDDE